MMIESDDFSAAESALVQRIAKEVFHQYCPENRGDVLSREDLCHFGVIGLLEARMNFQESAGVPWLAFASIRVRGAMLDHLRKQPLVRLPQSAQQKVRELRQAAEKIVQVSQEQTPERLAEELGWTVDEVNEVKNLSPLLVSVNEEGHQTEDDGPMGEILTCDKAGPEKTALQSELARLVNECLQKLAPMSRLVIVSRFLEGLKLKELATPMGCTMENVRIRQKKSEGQLTACIESQGWSIESLDDIINP